MLKTVHGSPFFFNTLTPRMSTKGAVAGLIEKKKLIVPMERYPLNQSQTFNAVPTTSDKNS